LIARTASRAASSLVAATSATSAPPQLISVPAGAITRTPVTPFMLCAGATSMLETLACACGQVSSAVNSISGRLTSDAYFARPLDLSPPSSRLMRVPIRRRLDCSGQA
jgi:hypothetical protein